MSRTWIALALFLPGVFVRPVVASFGLQQGETATAVSIGQAKGSPEGQVHVALELKPPTGISVRTVSLKVHFDPDVVSFMRVEPHEGVNVDATKLGAGMLSVPTTVAV